MEIILNLFNIGYLFQHIGTILQIRKIERKKSTEGVCIDTLVLFLIGALCRVIWINDTELRLFWITYLELTMAFITLFYSLYLCLFKYNNMLTFFEGLNRTEILVFLRWYVILVISAILAYFFYPGNDSDNSHWFDLQMLVSLSIYCEAGGLLPQIYITNKEKDSNNFSRLYLVFLSISRVLRLLFWFKLFIEDNGFVFLIIADLIHCFMLSGFVYSFFSNLNNFSLPQTIDSKSQSKRNQRMTKLC